MPNKHSKKPSSIAIQPRALNIEEAATYIGGTVWFLRTLVWDRRIPFLKLGHRYSFDRLDLDRFLEANKEPAL